MNSPILIEYIKLKKQIKEIEAKIIDIEMEVIEEFDREGTNQIPTSYGTLNLSSRKTWKYSSEVDKLKEVLSMTKRIEEKNGKAELQKDSQFIVFRANTN